ncbi:MAG: T9SS type A sorting domain-containing protein, partial [Bacteroidota bacterium]
LEIGRVDFHNLNVFDEHIVELTRRYLDKNHAYRNRDFVPIQRGLIENNFNGFAEGFGQNGLKNFSTLLGRDSVSYLDYNTLKTESYIWSYGCGGGNYQGAGGIANSSAMAADSFQTVFTFLFGSYFGDWDSPNNFLRSALGSGTILASAWAGRPNWNVHPMAMGYTIGYCTKLTQNNSGFSYDPGFGNRSIHVALMGDPSLRMYLVAAPSDVSLSESMEGITLAWSIADDGDDVIGYHIYNRATDNEHYVRLNEEIIATNSFVHSCPATTDSLQYLVKSVVLETTPSGRFYNESMGASAGIVPTIDRSVFADFSLSIDETEVSFTSTSTNATQFSWDFDDGTFSDEENPIHTFAPGTYQVSLIASNACSADTFSQTLMIMPSSVVELEDLGIGIAPNPVRNGALQLSSNSTVTLADITIVNVHGQVVLEQKEVLLNQQTIDVSKLASGTYILLIDSADQSGAGMLILIN